ncbi:MAG: TRAP transporter substrate-binding protein DctP [Myxococcales bacterium]|nr:TRAP transporter substrate-binding protein DctP [Myxococcales bacterium]
MRRVAAVVGIVAALASVAAAEPIVVRMASVAPEGSAWANLLHAWAQELEAMSAGAVRVKWYFSGITGDELETLEGIRKGHLDGIASGGMICERLSPSMKIQGLAGVFQSREEAAYVMERLRPTLEQETRRAGFELMIATGLGPEVLFTRAPVRSMADLRKNKMWRTKWRCRSCRRISTPRARPTTKTASTASSPFRRRRWPSSGRRKRATSPTCGSATSPDASPCRRARSTA